MLPPCPTKVCAALASADDKVGGRGAGLSQNVTQYPEEYCSQQAVLEEDDDEMTDADNFNILDGPIQDKLEKAHAFEQFEECAAKISDGNTPKRKRKRFSLDAYNILHPLFMQMMNEVDLEPTELSHCREMMQKIIADAQSRRNNNSNNKRSKTNM